MWESGEGPMGTHFAIGVFFIVMVLVLFNGVPGASISASLNPRKMPDLPMSEKGTSAGYQRLSTFLRRRAREENRMRARYGRGKDMHRVQASGVQLTYHYRLSSWSEDNVLTYFRKDKIKRSCRNPVTRKVLRFGGMYAHVYYDDKENYVGRYRITEQTCQAGNF